METLNAWILAIVLLIVGLIGGWMIHPGATLVDVPGEDVEVEVAVQANLDKIAELELQLAEAPEAEVLVSEADWPARAWEAILEEFDHDDEFYSCEGTEFDDDEIDFDLQDWSIAFDNNGDVSWEGDYDLDCDDGSHDGDLDEDRTYTVEWDDDEVEDANWDDARVELVA